MYSKSGLLSSAFVKEFEGQQTGLYVLANERGSEITITNYGAKIVSLMVPDKNGNLIDVLTSSLRHPKIFIKEFGDFLMPCHQHCLSVYILVQR